MKRILLLCLGLVLSVLISAQTSATATASVSAEIIHPVGTGAGGIPTTQAELSKKIDSFKEKERELILKALDPSKLQVVNNGNQFAISIDLEAIVPGKDQQEKSCRIIVHFN